MLVSQLIERKRDGNALTSGEWRALVEAYVAGRIPDYQMSAMLMAVVFRGLATEELTELVEAMLASGDRLDLSGLDAPRVDKHSIGGVGDKTSLLLAPLLAAAGVAVPMISGRGLGHTGGTLDKLEAIPGFRTGLSLAEARSQLDRIGVVMLGQTPELVPADRKLYALRDVTGTVESVPLIAASIMSKKLAEDLTGLVLDIKVGSGAFLTNAADSRLLGQTMITIGRAHRVPTVGLLTAMDRPLGHASGNALETAEAIRALTGRGRPGEAGPPADLLEVSFALGVEMLLLSGLTDDRVIARRRLEGLVRSGEAARRLERLIEAQGGDPRVVAEPERLPSAPVVAEYRAPQAATVMAVEPRTIGYGVIALGGGRRTAEDTVDPAVGFVVPVKPGDRVMPGQVLGTVHAATSAAADQGLAVLREAIRFGDEARPLPLVSHRITAEGVETL